MLNVLSKIYKWLEGWGPIAKVSLVALGAIIAIIKFFNGVWASAFDKIDSLVVASTPSSIGSFEPMGLANYVFPLDTLLNLFASYLVARVACYAIRIIKSWIPTIG